MKGKSVKSKCENNMQESERQRGRGRESRMYVEKGHSVGSKIFILQSYQIEDKYWYKEEQEGAVVLAWDPGEL